MRLADVQHQERAVSILRRSLRSGRTHHAYLFAGAEGVGKELAAMGLAARLLCEAESLAADADACGACVGCRLLQGETHPDFHLIHRGLHKQHPDPAVRRRKGIDLGVDVVRHFLIEPASRAPNRGRRRVFIVRDADRMSDAAQNALLKTLEEPPGAVCLVLVTASAESLLSTIRSRCQRVQFDLLPAAFVAQRLVAQGIPAESAGALAALADGSLGAALHGWRIGLLDALGPVAAAIEAACAGRDDPSVFAAALGDESAALAERARKAARGDAADEEPAPEEPEEEDEDEGGKRKKSKGPPTDELRAGLLLVLRLAAAVLRDGLLVSAGAGERCALRGEQARAERLAACGSARLGAGIRAVAEAEKMIDRNVAVPLACERLGVVLMGRLVGV